MKTILRVLAATLLVAAFLPLARSDESPGGDDEAHARLHAEARDAILGELSLLPGMDPRIRHCIQLAFLDDSVDEPTRSEAAQIVSAYDERVVVRRTAARFDEMTARGQTDLLAIWRDLIPRLKGHNFTVVALVSEAAGSPNETVRVAADALVSQYRFREAYFALRRRANRSTGEDRIRAIRTMGNLGDPRASWFLPDLLDDKEPGVTEAVYETLGRLRERAGTLTLKERLDHSSPKHRMLALEALMPLAVIDDLTALYRFAEASSDIDPEVKEDLYRLIARLEIVRDSGIETRQDPPQ